MTNLLLSYVALFVAASLIGFAVGWFLRSLATREARRDVDDEIDQLTRLLDQARRRAAESAG
jgi:hypothetical protein